MKYSILSITTLALSLLALPACVFAQNQEEPAQVRIVEDGGTGPYSAIMYTDGSLTTHTVFRPENLEPFGQKHLLPIIAWGNGACANFNSGLFNQVGQGMPGMPGVAKEELVKIHTPTLYLLGGESDIAYKNGMDDFERINHVPIFVGNMDVGHGGTYRQPHGGEYAVVATAWYKWQLKGDEEAGKLFTGTPCGLSQSEVWTVAKKNLP